MDIARMFKDSTCICESACFVCKEIPVFISIIVLLPSQKSFVNVFYSARQVYHVKTASCKSAMILIFFHQKRLTFSGPRSPNKRQALFYLSPARYFARTRLILPVGFRSSLKDASWFKLSMIRAMYLLISTLI